MYSDGVLIPRRAIFSVIREFRESRLDVKYAAAHPPKSGKSPKGCIVVSNANTAHANIARDAPANMVAIPTSAAIRGSTPNQA